MIRLRGEISRVRITAEVRNASLLKTTGSALGAHSISYSMGKFKPTPLKAWIGPQGTRSLRVPDFKTLST